MCGKCPTIEFGVIKGSPKGLIQSSMLHPDIFYKALFDRKSLWDPAVIDKVLTSFPDGYIDSSDLFLILAECIANSVLHGQAEYLGFHARKRGGILLLSFYQIPSMQGRVGVVLALARSGHIKECTTNLPGGMGFPILFRLADNITISNDFNKLHLWLRMPVK